MDLLIIANDLKLANENTSTCRELVYFWVTQKERQKECVAPAKKVTSAASVTGRDLTACARF